MGALVNGKWQQKPIATHNKTGHFVREDSAFRDWILKDATTKFQPEAGRYHIYIPYACPWACRTLIFLTLKKLHHAISFSSVKPLMLENGWKLDDKKYLYQIYLQAQPDYTGKVTVPVLWDKKLNTIVNNESSQIIRMLNSEFNAFAKNTYDFYPETLREDIDAINAYVYDHINNGVYRCGFAGTQEAYEQAFDKLFSALDTIEKRLAKQRYLVGKCLTEADWRLFTTLIRFDVVYFSHFKCNLRRIDDYPNLLNYVRELYQYPGIKETVDFNHIKTHYYGSHLDINPTGIIPKGPEIDYEKPHNRGDHE